MSEDRDAPELVRLQKKYNFSDECKKELRHWGRILVLFGGVMGFVIGWIVAVFLL